MRGGSSEGVGFLVAVHVHDVWLRHAFDLKHNKTS